MAFQMLWMKMFPPLLISVALTGRPNMSLFNLKSRIGGRFLVCLFYIHIYIYVYMRPHIMKLSSRCFFYSAPEMSHYMMCVKNKTKQKKTHHQPEWFIAAARLTHCRETHTWLRLCYHGNTHTCKQGLLSLRPWGWGCIRKCFRTWKIISAAVLETRCPWE